MKAAAMGKARAGAGEGRGPSNPVNMPRSKWNEVWAEAPNLKRGGAQRNEWRRAQGRVQGKPNTKPERGMQKRKHKWVLGIRKKEDIRKNTYSGVQKYPYPPVHKYAYPHWVETMFHLRWIHTPLGGNHVSFVNSRHTLPQRAPFNALLAGQNLDVLFLPVLQPKVCEKCLGLGVQRKWGGDHCQILKASNVQFTRQWTHLTTTILESIKL